MGLSSTTASRAARWLATDRGAALATFAMAFTVYALTASWTLIHNSDVYASVVPAIQVAQSGTPWLEGTPWEDTSPFFSRAGDHIVSNRQVGIIMLAVPFYALVGAPDAVWPSTLAVVTATAGTVTMLHLAMRRVVHPAAAWSAAAVFALGTPTWTVSADGLWSHAVTQLAIAGAGLAASRDRWWLAGVSLGAGILARPHMAMVPLVLGLGMAWSRRDPRLAVAVGVPSTMGAGVLLLLNRWIYGDWTVSGYGSYPSDSLATGVGGEWGSFINVAGFLVAPERGLFIWTPLALLLLPAVLRVSRTAPRWALWLALGGIAYTAVQLRINLFHGVDAFFGYRHGLELVTAALPLYAVGWAKVTSPVIRGTAAGLAVIQIAVMMMGAVHSSGFLSVSDVWRDNSIFFLIRQQPVAMPILISLVLAVAYVSGRATYRRALALAARNHE